MNMKCSKCGTENIAGARFCRHCGDSLANAKNIMDLYPKLNFVPTNFMDWKKPVVGMIIKRILFIPILLSFALCLYSIWSYNFYNQKGDNHLWWSDDKGYCTRTTDPIFDGMFYEYAECYKIDGSYYDHWDADYREYVSDPVEWTAERSLHYYQKEVLNVFLVSLGVGISLFLIMHFIICGYPKRPKDTKPLHEVADYCQKYSYWGIFRRRKTPKFVFFVKDNMFGILSVAHYSVFLPARYDFLSWREKNKYLNAVINGRNCIIDIYGKELK